MLVRMFWQTVLDPMGIGGDFNIVRKNKVLYKVLRHDTHFSIAEKLYGNQRYYDAVMHQIARGREDASHTLRPGEIIEFSKIVPFEDMGNQVSERANAFMMASRAGIPNAGIIPPGFDTVEPTCPYCGGTEKYEKHPDECSSCGYKEN